MAARTRRIDCRAVVHRADGAAVGDALAVAGGEHAGLVPGGESLSLSDLERQALVSALEKSGNNQSQAAKILKITRDTLRYRMKKYGLHHH